MKKLLLTSTIILAGISMIGCSGNSTHALSSFNEQLENVETIVSSINTSEISEVSPVNFYNSNNSDSLQEYKTDAFNNMSREEDIKRQVLSLNSYLKSTSNDNLKLNKNKTKALNTLTSNIKKYSVKLKNTKEDVKSNVSKIKKNLKSSKYNVENTQSAYIALNSNMNERFVYLCNIFNNLEQAYILISDVNKNFSTDLTSPNADAEKNTEIKSEKSKEQNTSKGFKKNIDSFSSYQKQESDETSKNQYVPQYNQPALPPYNYGTQPFNYPYNYGYNYGYNNPYMNNPMPYGFNGYGYNNFGYNGFNNFNPNRNTDTFYALNKNIDTYRTNPYIFNNNFFNNYSNNIPVSSEVEVIKDNNNAAIDPEDKITNKELEYSVTSSKLNKDENDTLQTDSLSVEDFTIDNDCNDCTH